MESASFDDAAIDLGQFHFRMLDPEFLLSELTNERPEFRLPHAEIQIKSPLLPMRGNEAFLLQ